MIFDEEPLPLYDKFIPWLIGCPLEPEPLSPCRTPYRDQKSWSPGTTLWLTCTDLMVRQVPRNSDCTVHVWSVCVLWLSYLLSSYALCAVSSYSFSSYSICVFSSSSSSYLLSSFILRWLVWSDWIAGAGARTMPSWPGRGSVIFPQKTCHLDLQILKSDEVCKFLVILSDFKAATQWLSTQEPYHFQPRTNAEHSLQFSFS